MLKKLLAGETIVYNIPNKIIKQRKRIFIKPNANKNFDHEEFCYMGNKTVKMCSIGQRKIGVFLSGGLDSTLVAYELKKIMGSVDTFTNHMIPGANWSSEDLIMIHDLNDCVKKLSTLN